MRRICLMVACIALLGACSAKKHEPAPVVHKTGLATISIIGPTVFVENRIYTIKPGPAIEPKDATLNARALLIECAKDEGVFEQGTPAAASRYDSIAECASTRSNDPPAEHKPADGAPAPKHPKRPQSFTLVPSTP